MYVQLIGGSVSNTYIYQLHLSQYLRLQKWV